jgi:tetratricopeptide (TPR) repeat protein
MGYPDRAVDHASTALRLAERLDHPFTSAYALFHVGLLDLWRGELDVVSRRASMVLEIAEEHDYQVWNAVALVLHGVAQTGLGQPEQGLDEVERGVVRYRGLKTPPIFWPVLLSLRAGAFALAGRSDEGLEVVEEAIAVTSESDMLAMLKGDLLSSRSDVESAVSSYERSLRLARGWGARMSELQAAIRLTRLHRAAGKQPDGADTLREVYATFTEGFESHHLVEARAVLDDAHGAGV